MAVSAAVDIANIALQRLGQKTISTLTESTRDANVVNQLYVQNRDYCLMLADWDCLLTRLPLFRAGSVAISGITAAEPPVVTITSHGFKANELVTIEDVAGMTQVNGNTYRVGATTTNSITLFDTAGVAVDGSDYTAYSSAGAVYFDPGPDWEFVYDLPDDTLRMVQLLDDKFGMSEWYEWRKERNHIYADIENAGLTYVKRETDHSLYQEDLIEVIASRLAWSVAMRINADKELRSVLFNEHQLALRRAKMTNATGFEDEGPPAVNWVDVQ